MCKKIVIRGNFPLLTPDRGLDYVHFFSQPGETMEAADIYILSSTPILRLAGDVLSARRLNPLSRVVVLPSPYEENLLSALFPFVEFLLPGSVLLSEVYSGKGTYHNDSMRRSLSERERKILPPLSYGMSDKEIAFVLGISERTVVRTKQRVIAKAGLISSGQLSIFSALMSWIKDEEERCGVKKKRKVQ